MYQQNHNSVITCGDKGGNVCMDAEMVPDLFASAWTANNQMLTILAAEKVFLCVAHSLHSVWDYYCSYPDFKTFSVFKYSSAAQEEWVAIHPFHFYPNRITLKITQSSCIFIQIE